MPYNDAVMKLLLLEDRRLWVAGTVAALFVGLVLWLLIRDRGNDKQNENWTKAFSGPFRLELAEGGELEALNGTTVTAPDLSDENLQLKLRVQEAVGSRLAGGSGMPVEIVLEAFPERSFPGRLARVNDLAPEEVSKDSAFNAVVEISATQPSFKPGMTVRSVILLDSLSQAIAVPESAVFEINGEPVVFPRKDWPHPRAVQLGSRSGGAIVIVDGVSDGEEVSFDPPKERAEAQRLGSDTYKKSARATREQLSQHLDEMFKRYADTPIEGKGQMESTSAISGGADSSAAIEELLAMPGGEADSGKTVSIQQMRVGPGEGGKLAPLSPEMLQQMKAGEKISVSVPAAHDSSADSLSLTPNRNAAPDTSRTTNKPPAGP